MRRHLLRRRTFSCRVALLSRARHISPALIALLAVAALMLTTCSGPGGERIDTAGRAPGSPGAPPEEAGLSWHACELRSDVEEWQQIETCLGQPLPEWSAAEKAWAAQGPAGSRELRIGQNLYATRAVEVPHAPWTIYTFSRDGWPIKAFVGQQAGHDPDITLLNLANRAAWEYADDSRATIIYDGRDLRQVYGLDAAYRPYLIAGKLIFVGRKDNRYFIMYDGRRIAPQFDQIIVAYCCETMLYSVRSGGGRYVFRGTRNGRRYLVEVSYERNHFDDAVGDVIQTCRHY